MTDKKYSIVNNLVEVARRLIRLSAAAALLVTLLSLLGSLYWFFELFTHFRLQLAAAAIAMALLAGLFRMPRSAVLFGILAVANLAFTAQYVMPGVGDARAGANTIRILSFNLSARNDDYDGLVNLIETTRPDIVGLVEVERRWEAPLARLEAAYPYRIVRPEDGYFGLALLSRFPLRELDTSPYMQDGLQTAILSELELPWTSATLAVSHVMAPMSADRAALRNEQLEGLSTFFRDDENGARILIGDLNITPWSPRYDVIEAGTGLRNAARNRGYLGTWPASPALLRIPIDHCLLSDSFGVLGIETGPDIGSDHLPLIVDVGVAGSGDGRP